MAQGNVADLVGIGPVGHQFVPPLAGTGLHVAAAVPTGPVFDVMAQVQGLAQAGHHLDLQAVFLGLADRLL